MALCLFLRRTVQGAAGNWGTGSPTNGISLFSDCLAFLCPLRRSFGASWWSNNAKHATVALAMMTCFAELGLWRAILGLLAGCRVAGPGHEPGPIGLLQTFFPPVTQTVWHDPIEIQLRLWRHVLSNKSRSSCKRVMPDILFSCWLLWGSFLRNTRACWQALGTGLYWEWARAEGCQRVPFHIVTHRGRVDLH
jgi:hypothetical protein